MRPKYAAIFNYSEREIKYKLVALNKRPTPHHPKLITRSQHGKLF